MIREDMINTHKHSAQGSFNAAKFAQSLSLLQKSTAASGRKQQVTKPHFLLQSQVGNLRKDSLQQFRQKLKDDVDLFTYADQRKQDAKGGAHAWAGQQGALAQGRPDAREAAEARSARAHEEERGGHLQEHPAEVEGVHADEEARGVAGADLLLLLKATQDFVESRPHEVSSTADTITEKDFLL